MITLRSDGTRKLRHNEKRLIKWFARLRKLFSVQVKVQEHGYESFFACATPVDAFRPISLWVKEPGTMAWIQRDTRPDDCFLDIGANIGIYTIAAAHRVGTAGKVYAVEPHKVNGVTLMRNVVQNNFADRVVIVPVALSDEVGFATFHYLSLDSASTGSQLGSNRNASTGKEFQPVASEMVPVTSIDQLIAQGVMQTPNLVKIDVDGIELAILRGMKHLLTGAQRPRSVQVELNPGEQDDICAFMTSAGYKILERHHTLYGQQASDQGQALEDVAHNAVFVPI